MYQSYKDSFKDFNNIVNVGIADIKYVEAPKHLRTNLGSCVALILYHKRNKAGALVHIMLPKSYKPEAKVGKCADTAVPEIIAKMLKINNCVKGDIIAKIFGGAKMLINSTSDIGNENVLAVINLVKEHGIKIVSKKTGGNKGYVVQLDSDTGNVMCRVFGQDVEFY